MLENAQKTDFNVWELSPIPDELKNAIQITLLNPAKWHWRGRFAVPDGSARWFAWYLFQILSKTLPYLHVDFSPTFFRLSPLTEDSLWRATVLSDKPPRNWRSNLEWWDAGFEPRRVRPKSGELSMMQHGFPYIRGTVIFLQSCGAKSGSGSTRSRNYLFKRSLIRIRK